MSLSAEEQKLIRLYGQATYERIRVWALRALPGTFVRTVTTNGKEFVVRRDEHGEYYEALGDAPRDEGQAQP